MSRKGRWRLRRAAILGAAFALQACYQPPNSATKPRLLLLSGLPLMFGETFSLDQQSAPLIDEIKRNYEVVAIASTAPDELDRGRLLVMAQPRAQTADNLVALDRWVRGGGHLLLFADPRLEWDSELPLGDLNRPPPMFADTGLLGHWGLRLDAPDRAGPVTVTGADGTETYRSPGRLVRTGGTCRLSSDGIVADCAIGQGRAIIVADADLLNDAGSTTGEAAGRLLLLLSRLGLR